MRLTFGHNGADGHSNPVDEMDRPWEETEPPYPSDTKKARKAWRARLRRRDKIQRIADTAAEKWRRRHQPPDAPPPPPEAPLYRPLPRPKGLGLKDTTRQSALPAPHRELAFKAGVFRSAVRILHWLRGGCLFVLGVFWDWLNGRNTVENRARRLRETFETMGITFVKIGQQLSMRLDLLPYAYTRELEKLLDKLRPFPPDEAMRMIERAAGQPLNEVLSAFDTEPIGSASVACVYQGILATGERVAIKVRRPGIGVRLAADLRALGWLLTLFELGFLAPGFTDNFIFELRMMLMEELDFIREARFDDLYRRRMRKAKHMHFVTAPKVYFAYSNDEVMVTDFVSGIWLTDILRALETKNLEAQAKLDEMNIEPVILARRIQLIARYNNFENIFFHADLHPANIVVQPGNKIVLIDFGSCGSFSRTELNSWRRFFDAQSIDDVGGMVQAALGIIEPLPPIDRDSFGKRLEAMFWNDLYAIKSKHSTWTERSTSRLWIGFLTLSREFQVPMRLNTLRMIRASMLSDTIAVRLDHDQDPYREFRYYEKGAGKRAKKRVFRRLRQLDRPRKFIGIENGIESVLKFVYQFQRTVDSLASIRIGEIIAKVDYFVSLMFKHLAWAFMTLMTATLGLWLYGWFGYRNYTNLGAVLGEVLKNGWWQIVAFTPSALVLWRLSFRLKERRPWQ